MDFSHPRKALTCTLPVEAKAMAPVETCFHGGSLPIPVLPLQADIFRAREGAYEKSVFLMKEEEACH